MRDRKHLGSKSRRLQPLAVTAVVLAAHSSRLFAEVNQPDFQHDPVEYWAARALTWALVLAVILVASTLVKVLRDRLHGNSGRVLMLVGVVLLPSFSVTIGMLLVFTRAEKVEFCASCHHVMRVYAEDMSDPAGTGLAAVHFSNRYIPQNQCYECHTSYGLFGTVEAKLHGIAEVARYYTGSYDSPVTMWKPYPNADCLKCHAESEKWQSVEAHTDDGVELELFEDRTSCMSCHESAHEVRMLTAMAGP